MTMRLTVLAILMAFGATAAAQQQESPSPEREAMERSQQEEMERMREQVEALRQESEQMREQARPAYTETRREAQAVVDQLNGTQEAEAEQPGQGPIALSIGVLVFSTLLSAMLVYLRLKKSVNESTFFRMGGLVLVIGAGLFLIVAGYTQQQIAPMMGLLGTVAGYLLHKGEEGKSQL